MITPIRIAVVGHTNAGKTSLLRTLTRRVAFGEVSDRPGTTRHVEQVALRVDGHEVVVFLDTPGLEDSVSLREFLRRAAPDEATPPERIRVFLDGPEAHGLFEQEAKVLRTMLDVDAAFLVIDAREPVLPKFRAEVELLASCARPVLPVLNFVHDPRQREPDWRALLSAYGLHSVVRFDAVAPFVGAERELYHDLGTLLGAHRRTLQAVVGSLQAEAASRRAAAARRIAEGTVEVLALRQTVEPDTTGTPGPDVLIAALRDDVAARAHRCADDLLVLYGFRKGDADEAALPAMEGRWDLDFFSAEAARDAGVRLGKGAAIGAAVGVVADVAMAGLSLGTATAIGATLGGVLSQGLGPAGRKLANLLTNTRELTVEDSVATVLVDWQVTLVDALERRGHGATGRLVVTTPVGGHPDRDPAAVVSAAQPARAHPDWAARPARFIPADPRREHLIEAVAAVVRPMIDGAKMLREPDPQPHPNQETP